ncbi:MAG: sugar transferase [Luteolibacter sp.]
MNVSSTLRMLDASRVSKIVPGTSAGTLGIPCWKRRFDVILAVLTLPLILPVVVLAALWIKAVSPGPAIFRQGRVGHRGQSFVLLKLRTMKMDADVKCHTRHFKRLVAQRKPLVKLDQLGDSRLIRGGSLLRASGIDELPQWINILRGEMSWVGPRPCLPQELSCFRGNRGLRFFMRPGLTGLWQSEGGSLASFDQMNAMDARYLIEADWQMDLAILCRTPRAALARIRALFN